MPLFDKLSNLDNLTFTTIGTYDDYKTQSTNDKDYYTFNRFDYPMSLQNDYTIDFKLDDYKNTIDELFGYKEEKPVKLKKQKNKESKIKKIIFNDPATIIFWEDGTKTVVKVAEGDEYSAYYGFCCAIAKKIFGNNTKIKKLLKKFGAYENKSVITENN